MRVAICSKCGYKDRQEDILQLDVFCPKCGGIMISDKRRKYK